MRLGGEKNSACYEFSEHVSERVLICFIMWAYLGDYSTETVGISSYAEQNRKISFGKNLKKNKKERLSYSRELSFAPELEFESAPVESLDAGNFIHDQNHQSDSFPALDEANSALLLHI